MSTLQIYFPIYWTNEFIKKYIDDRYIQVIDDDFRGVKAAAIWLIFQSYNLHPKPKEVYSSYHIKHRIEEAAGFYVSDRDAELAAKILGIPYKVYKGDEFVDLPIHKPFINRQEHFEELRK